MLGQPEVGKRDLVRWYLHEPVKGTGWSVAPSNAREDGSRVKRRRADIYVLARHEGDDHRTGWSFFVVPRQRLDERNRDSIGLGRLTEWGIEEVDTEGLAPAVEVTRRSQAC